MPYYKLSYIRPTLNKRKKKKKKWEMQQTNVILVEWEIVNIWMCTLFIIKFINYTSAQLTYSSSIDDVMVICNIVTRPRASIFTLCHFENIQNCWYIWIICCERLHFTYNQQHQGLFNENIVQWLNLSQILQSCDVHSTAFENWFQLRKQSEENAQRKATTTSALPLVWVKCVEFIFTLMPGEWVKNLLDSVQ